MTRTNSFKIYISRVLSDENKANGNKFRLSKQALDCIDKILQVISNRITENVYNLLSSSSRKTILLKDVKTSAQLLFPREIYTQLDNFATPATIKYIESENDRKDSGSVIEKAQTRESRCGLIFSCSFSEKYVRRFGQGNYKVSSVVPVYLTGVLEGLLRHIFSQTEETASRAKKVILTFRHLKTSADANPNVSVLFSRCGIVLISPEKKSIIQRAPINRLIRSIAKSQTKEKIRFTKDFLLSMQLLIENDVIAMCRKASRIAKHSGRVTVYHRDFLLAEQILSERILSEELFSTETMVEKFMDKKIRIPEAPLKKMATQGGITRYGVNCTDWLRRYIFMRIKDLTANILLCSSHHNQQTITTDILCQAIQAMGIFPSITTRKKVHRSRKTQTGATESSQGPSEGPSKDGPTESVEPSPQAPRKGKRKSRKGRTRRETADNVSQETDRQDTEPVELSDVEM